jgi:hypothetical protein
LGKNLRVWRGLSFQLHLLFLPIFYHFSTTSERVTTDMPDTAKNILTGFELA